MEDNVSAYAFDWVGGPVYRKRGVPAQQADAAQRTADAAHMIAVLVTPGEPDSPVELREYFALNLRQAIARAAELQVRLCELETPAILAGIRPATDAELDAFFRAIDRLEEEMPGPVTEAAGSVRTATMTDETAKLNKRRTMEDGRPKKERSS